MSSTKRQQARNEKALQELVKSVPGNSTCADCIARNPGWASWSLGIFLCMRCAALHRKLGTHISKVKSLSMDSWTNDQVDNMKNVGNIKSNKLYNPTNIKPPVPFDVDEADSAMERYIRQKYMDKDLQGRVEQAMGPSVGSKDRSSSRHRGARDHLESDDDNPPPLPPKAGKGFFRSASNIFPLSSKTKKANARADADARQSPYIDENRDHDLHNNRDVYDEYSPTSPKVQSKPSRVFGTHVSGSGNDEHENKMLRLRDMGFLDEKRNATVLKGLNGNLEKSIETLVRLGEGNSPGRGSMAHTPTTPASAGISFPRSAGNDRPSNSTFDLPAPPAAMPQSAQSTGTYVQNNPFQSMNGSNPFGPFPSQSQSAIDQAFNGLSLAPNPAPQQQLFPNHTGGHTTGGYQAPPPMPTIPQNYRANPFLTAQSQQQQQQQVPQSQAYNPFLQQTQQAPQQQMQQPIQQQTPQPSPYNGQQAFANNPYMTQQNQNFGQQAAYGQPQQAQQSQQPPLLQQQSQYGFQQQQTNPYQQQSNPYQQQPQQQQQSNPYQQAQPQYQQYGAQQLQPQPTGRANKTDILNLYNYPQMAPTPPPQHQEPRPQMNQMPQQQYPDTPTSTQHMASPGVSAGSKNPFMSAPPNGARHVSQESISVNADWQNGRHSPDAFASLSARSFR